jgi:hypothetical protein
MRSARRELARLNQYISMKNLALPKSATQSVIGPFLHKSFISTCRSNYFPLFLSTLFEESSIKTYAGLIIRYDDCDEDAR